MSNTISKLPGWALVLTFLAILVILAVFGDLFTFITGTLVMIVIFAGGYNKEHLDKL